MTELSNRRHEYFPGSLGAKIERLNDGFADDMRRLFIIFYHFQSSDSSAICWTLQQLWELARTESPSPAKLLIVYMYEWVKGKAEVTRPFIINRWPENEICLLAVELGFHEFSPRKHHETVLENMLYRAVQSLCLGSYTKHYLKWQGLAPFYRKVRSLATCLEYGVPTSTLVWVKRSHGSVTVWQTLVWHCIVTSTFRASPVPAWLLFLLHGAEQNFTLKFEQTCNFSQIDKSGKLISVTGLWGTKNEQVHSPIYIHEDQGGIVELARVQDWSVSLMDIIGFWLPRHIETFRRIGHLVGERKVLPEEQLKNLKLELGLDPASWRDQMWDIPEALFQSWEGSSEILPSS